MIRLRRSGLSAVVEALVKAWNADYLGFLERGEPVPPSLETRYRDPSLKAELRAETHDKCAYCESKVTHIYPGDVEHILPKAHFKELALAYENLTYVCHLCNNSKSDYRDAKLPLVNPFEEDPADHLIAAGPLVFYRPGSDRGFITQNKLKLNRAALVERRHERLSQINTLAHLYRKSPAPVQEVLEAELRKEAQDSGEYALAVRTYLSQQCGIQL